MPQPVKELPEANSSNVKLWDSFFFEGYTIVLTWAKKSYQSLWLRNNFCLKVVACLQNKSDAVLPVDIVYGFQF